MSSGWGLFIAIITIGNIVAMLWLLVSAGKKKSGDAKEGDTTGHTWDEDLQEYNNPLPRWWLWLFVITVIFTAIYLALYPGIGIYDGSKQWSQVDQYNQQMAAADEKYGAIYAEYAKTPVPELIKNSKAMDSGQRLFLTYCSTCHGTDATGYIGYPNLTDNDWLFGGSPEAIKTSIRDGRYGSMPKDFAAGLNDEQVDELVAYVLSLSGREVDAGLAEKGAVHFNNLACGIACHGVDGSGNSESGFPNLTDKVWLHGGSPGQVKATITQGRTSEMPPHARLLNDDKIHVLAAYVYSLSNK